MTTSICRICAKPVEVMFSAVLIQKYSTQYFKCSQCGYVQTEDPHWLEEAYESSINYSDTGMIMRNLWLRNVATTLIYFFFDNKGPFLDHGSGYGIFVRLMRDVGFDFSWQDKHTENLFAKGFEFSESENSKVELLTCFEAFEHFVEPAVELENLLCSSRNILLSTEFIPEPVPAPGKWWYYGMEHGQHIGFFQKKTFDYLAEKHNLHFYTNGQNIHLLTDKHLLPFAFKWMIKLSKYIAPLIQRRMKSLTWKDMEKLTALSS